ncbi:MAG: endonuclease/exonuclease/phosphatase family protein, partial [Acidimicrobiia bacterium]|nr:endonuclease/exonuclease/phosphatase family protein [Acidimicrobiia bacterium]
RFSALWLIVCLVAASCGSNDTPAADPTTDPTPTAVEQPAPTATPEPPAALRIATYNAGLAEGFVPYATERRPLVVDAIGDLSADIVFVQEFWDSESVAALRDATVESFPNTMFPDPIADEGGGEPACTIDELADLEACVELNCSDASPDELVACVLSSCAAQYNGLCVECQSCIAANVGSTVEEAITNCTLASAAFAYEGSLGTGLLSAGVILDTDVLVLESSLTRRAVVYALVDTEAFGPVHVFGTHLSAVFADIPFPGDGTWEQEQAAQIVTLLDFVGSKAARGEPVVLLGDFNTGPAGETYEAEVGANYELLSAELPMNPYVANGDGLCTFCGDNPLVGSDSSVVIDHIFVRDFDGTASTTRVLDELVDIDVEGTPTTSALSDHFGLLSTLTPD